MSLLGIKLMKIHIWIYVTKIELNAISYFKSAQYKIIPKLFQNLFAYLIIITMPLDHFR